MRLSEIMNITNAEFFYSSANQTIKPSVLQREIQTGGSADLMSDVLCYNMSQALLITGLINPQTVRTAEMADTAAILIVRGKTPPLETIKVAWDVDIPIIGTKMTMFEACGRLFAAGLPTAIRPDGEPNPDCTAQ